MSQEDKGKWAFARYRKIGCLILGLLAVLLIPYGCTRLVRKVVSKPEVTTTVVIAPGDTGFYHAPEVVTPTLTVGSYYVAPAGAGVVVTDTRVITVTAVATSTPLPVYARVVTDTLALEYPRSGALPLAAYLVGELVQVDGQFLGGDGVWLRSPLGWVHSGTLVAIPPLPYASPGGVPVGLVVSPTPTPRVRGGGGGGTVKVTVPVVSTVVVRETVVAYYTQVPAVGSTPTVTPSPTPTVTPSATPTVTPSPTSGVRPCCFSVYLPVVSR